MIITRTPFRVSFIGGGTDLPWFYENYGGGAVISLAVDLHMYISCHPLFESQELLLKYSQTERVTSPSLLKHPIAREVLSIEDISGLDIGVSADVPAGTGLGSSSSFTVGLINAVSAQKGVYKNKQELAEYACSVEINRLNEPIGKQDQFAAAFGGLNLISFLPSGKVEVKPIALNRQQQIWLENSLLLVRVDGKTRSASELLVKQRELSTVNSDAIASLTSLRELTLEAFDVLSSDIRTLGDYVNTSWDLKKRSNPNATNLKIDDIIRRGLAAGASAGKLLGAGGSGFVLLVCSPESIDGVAKVFDKGAAIKIGPDYVGSTVIYSH